MKKYLILIIIFLFLGKIFSQGNEEKFPKISEISEFCKKTLEECQDNEEIAPEPLSNQQSTLKIQALDAKIQKMVAQEEQNIRQLYLRKKGNKKWAKDDRAHVDYLLEIGLFSEAIEFLKDTSQRQNQWIAAGNSQFLLALIFQRRGKSAQAQTYYKNGQELLKQIRNKKGNKPQWLIDQSERLQQQWISSSGELDRKYNEYTIAYKEAIKNIEDIESWRKLIHIADNLEYRVETLCFLQYIWESMNKKLDDNVKREVLFELARLYGITSQGNRCLDIIKKIEKENLAQENKAADIVYYKAKAYLELQNYVEAEKYLTSLERKFPTYCKEKDWLVKRLKERIVQND